MASAVWTGVLTFGLVSLPVQLFAATEDHAIRFRQLQRGTSDRVRNKRVNERTGEEVPYNEIVKGYPTEDGFVVVEPDELADIAPGRSRALEIIGFVDLDQVDPVYYRSSYYLAPDGAEYGKVYALLREALARAGRAGLGTFVMRDREYLTTVRPSADVLVADVLRWATEVRDPHRELGGSLPRHAETTEAEIDTAVQLIEAMAIDWALQSYQDIVAA
ncbi:Ku protein [Saccharopolyspora shandongensis]|uniref:non-homologous end joining protein Ku n=1 Tax=Saccharopolyspora shandongensis TaxID=418495 RepID=UPI00341C6BD5